MGLPATRATKEEILSLLSQAQALLGSAAELASQVRGWAKQWTQIEKQYDAIKATWHEVNNAPTHQP